jgi:hypothetical protein
MERRWRDGASLTARALEGHELPQQWAHAISPGWEEQALALKTGGLPDPV